MYIRQKCSCEEKVVFSMIAIALFLLAYFATSILWAGSSLRLPKGVYVCKSSATLVNLCDNQNNVLVHEEIVQIGAHRDFVFGIVDCNPAIGIVDTRYFLMNALSRLVVKYEVRDDWVHALNVLGVPTPPQLFRP